MFRCIWTRSDMFGRFVTFYYLILERWSNFGFFFQKFWRSSKAFGNLNFGYFSGGRQADRQTDGETPKTSWCKPPLDMTGSIHRQMDVFERMSAHLDVDCLLTRSPQSLSENYLFAWLVPQASLWIVPLVDELHRIVFRCTIVGQTTLSSIIWWLYRIIHETDSCHFKWPGALIKYRYELEQCNV